MTDLRARLKHNIHSPKTLLSSYSISTYIFDENIDLVFEISLEEGYKLKESSLNYETTKKFVNDVNTADNS